MPDRIHEEFIVVAGLNEGTDNEAGVPFPPEINGRKDTVHLKPAFMLPAAGKRHHLPFGEDCEDPVPGRVAFRIVVIAPDLLREGKFPGPEFTDSGRAGRDRTICRYRAVTQSSRSFPDGPFPARISPCSVPATPGRHEDLEPGTFGIGAGLADGHAGEGEDLVGKVKAAAETVFPLEEQRALLLVRYPVPSSSTMIEQPSCRTW